MKVSILTSALPSRIDMLKEAIASVHAQTHPDVEYLLAFDDAHRGAGHMLNELLDDALGERVMVLDDDDLLDPCHVATVLAAAEETDADVVYSLPRVTGGTFDLYNLPFDPRYLHRGVNCVSHNALMRTSLVRHLGGWTNTRAFDLDLFCRLEQAGAQFHKVPLVTWTYRLHDSNWSHGTLSEAAAL